MQTKYLKILLAAASFLPIAFSFAAGAKLDLTPQLKGSGINY